MELSYLTVFIANVVNDILAVLFVIQVGRGHRWTAGLASALIVSLFGVTAIYVVPDPRHIIPAALGAMLGTVIMVRK